MFTKIKKALVLTLPVMTGYLSVGMAFGLMSVQMGLPAWCPLIMSVLVYAGALQLVSLAWLASQMGLLSIFFLSLIVNARQVLYGLSLYGPFRRMGKLKPYMVFSLTDETYALLSSRPDLAEDKTTAFLLAALNQSYWIGGTLLGLGLGRFLSQTLLGVEFSLVALFASMMLTAFENKANRPLMAYALAVGLISLLLVGPDYFLLLAMGVLVLSVLWKEG